MKKIYTLLFALMAIASSVKAWDNSLNGHEFVDLGLPSGTLWATCNIGANSPEDYGYYFAWGVTEPKSVYNWDKYKYCKGSASTLTKYCTNSEYGYNGFTDNLVELLPEDDAATASWSEGWQMPSTEQLRELINDDYTVKGLANRNGVQGILITSRTNANQIFLPFGGWVTDRYRTEAGETGNYWSRSLDTIDPYPHYAEQLQIKSNSYKVASNIRCDGASVRPVCSTTPVEPYVEFMSDGTMWFRYDDLWQTCHGEVFRVWTNNEYQNLWAHKGEDIKRIVIDASFANVQFNSLRLWFSNMTNLESITGLSYLNTNGVTNMEGMFFMCSSLKSLDLSGFNTADVTEMGSMFKGCSNLETIYIGSGWTTENVNKSENMFMGCTKITGMQGTTYNESALDKTYAHVDEGTSNPGYLSIIPITFEVDGIYYKTTNLTTVEVTYKDNNYNSYSGQITIPQVVEYEGTSYNVTAIGTKAFYGCIGLKEVTIPASITRIGNQAFAACQALERIKCHATTPPTIESNTFSSYSATLFVPTGSVPAYQTADYWKNFNNIQEADSYSLWIGGIQVNEFNKNNIPVGEGTAVFIPEVPALYLEDCTITGNGTYNNASTGYGAGIYSNISGLVVCVFGNVTVNGTPSDTSTNGIFFNDKTTIYGNSFDATLTATGFNGIYSDTLTIDVVGEDAHFTVIADGSNGGLVAKRDRHTRPQLIYYHNRPLTLPSSNLTLKCRGNTISGISYWESISGNILLQFTAPDPEHMQWNPVQYMVCDTWGDGTPIVGEWIVMESVIPYDFEVDGIYYKIMSDGTVEVTYKDYSYNSYSGDIVIPSTVTYDGVTYTVTRIGNRAFCTPYVSTGLTSVTIPETVTYIGFQAFAGCTALVTITCLAPVPPEMENNSFDRGHRESINVYVPYGCLDAYRNNYYWNFFVNMFELPQPPEEFAGNIWQGAIVNPRTGELSISGPTAETLTLTPSAEDDRQVSVTYESFTLKASTSTILWDFTIDGVDTYETENGTFYLLPEQKTITIKTGKKGLPRQFGIKTLEGVKANNKLATKLVMITPDNQEVTIWFGPDGLNLNQVQAVIAVVDDFVTGVSPLGQQTTDNGQQSIYNLAGQRLSKPQKGINIINGKKVLIK